jgi:amino acid transporter
MALLFILIVPWLFSVPMALASAEMATAMPVEGGFYRWTRAAFLGFSMRLVELDRDIFHVGIVWSGAGGLCGAGHPST